MLSVARASLSGADGGDWDGVGNSTVGTEGDVELGLFAPKAKVLASPRLARVQRLPEAEGAQRTIDLVAE